MKKDESEALQEKEEDYEEICLDEETHKTSRLISENGSQRKMQKRKEDTEASKRRYSFKPTESEKPIRTGELIKLLEEEERGFRNKKERTGNKEPIQMF